MAFLTSRTLASGVTSDDLIHIVITGDTSQNSAGSSYKAKIGQVLSLISETPALFSSGVTANTVTIGGVVLTASGGCLNEFCINKSVTIGGVKAGSGEGSWPKNTSFGKDSVTSNTTGQQLTAMGYKTLESNTTGDNNSAFGYKALSSVSNGNRNIAFGSESLETLNSSDNISVGHRASKNATSALFTVSIGTDALLNNNNDYNVAVGHNSLSNNTVGTDNVAVGYNVLSSNSIGSANVGFGSLSLNSTTVGDGNVAIGYLAGASNITGSYNTFIGGGSDCLFSNLVNSVAIGNGTLISQSNTVVVGNGQNVGVNTSTPTSTLHVAGITGYQQFRMETQYTPGLGTVTPTGNDGDVAWDNDYIYIKTPVGWKRAGLSTF